MMLHDRMLPLICLVLLASAVCGVTHPSRQSGISLPLIRSYGTRTGVLASNVSITNSNEYVYIVNLSIGGQAFPVTLDTGSSDLWVVSTDCIKIDCQNVSKYSAAASHSLKATNTNVRIDYLLGSARGSVGLEDVMIGQYAISSQVFALANDTEGLGLSNNGNSGVLGLSFPQIASIPSTAGQTILQNLFSSFGDQDRYFAFSLGRNQSQNSSSSSASSTISSFTIGQLDPALANDTNGFQFTTVVSAGPNNYDYWKIPLHGITINSLNLPLSKSLVPGAKTPIAVLDTGTTLILGPTPDVATFWAAVGGPETVRKNPQTNSWEVQCNRAVIVKFNLGDKNDAKEYAVHPGDISWEEGKSDGNWCMGGIQANDGVSSADWLLGDAFLRNVYATHHDAMSSRPPLVGLLSLTDPNQAIAEFTNERGHDPAPSPSARTLGTRAAGERKMLLVSVLCSTVGWVIGAAGTMLFCSRRVKKNKIKLQR